MKTLLLLLSLVAIIATSCSHKTLMMHSIPVDNVGKDKAFGGTNSFRLGLHDTLNLGNLPVGTYPINPPIPYQPMVIQKNPAPDMPSCHYDIKPPYYLIQFGDSTYSVVKYDVRNYERRADSTTWYLRPQPLYYPGNIEFFSLSVVDAAHEHDSCLVKLVFKTFYDFTTYKTLHP